MCTDYKNHLFAKDGFNYRTAYYRDYDGQYYRLTLSVGKNGEVNTIYNIGKIKEAPFPFAAQRPGTKGAGKNSASNNRVPHQDPTVKNQFSFSSPKADTEESIFDADVPMRHIDGSVRTYAEYQAAQDAKSTCLFFTPPKPLMP